MSQKYTQKYTIVSFFPSQNVSINFSALDWPLHVTILDTFKTKWSLSTLIQALNNLTLAIAPFEVITTDKAILGADKDVPVKLLKPDESILALHNKLLELSKAGSFIFNTPEFVGDGFLPHITDQQDNSPQIGQKYNLSSISLVDMFPNDDYMRRVVAGNFSLRG